MPNVLESVLVLLLFFTKFEFASSSQIVPIFVYFTAKIGTICEEDADSNFVKKSNKTRTDSSSDRIMVNTSACEAGVRILAWPVFFSN